MVITTSSCGLYVFPDIDFNTWKGSSARANLGPDELYVIWPIKIRGIIRLFCCSVEAVLAGAFD